MSSTSQYGRKAMYSLKKSWKDRKGGMVEFLALLLGTIFIILVFVSVILVITVLSCALHGGIIYLLWNFVLSPVFGIKVITFIQSMIIAFSLNILRSLLRR